MVAIFSFQTIYMPVVHAYLFLAQNVYPPSWNFKGRKNEKRKKFLLRGKATGEKNEGEVGEDPTNLVPSVISLGTRLRTQPKHERFRTRSGNSRSLTRCLHYRLPLTELPWRSRSIHSAFVSAFWFCIWRLRPQYEQQLKHSCRTLIPSFRSPRREPFVPWPPFGDQNACILTWAFLRKPESKCESSRAAFSPHCRLETFKLCLWENINQQTLMEGYPETSNCSNHG